MPPDIQKSLNASLFKNSNTSGGGRFVSQQFNNRGGESTQKELIPRLWIVDFSTGIDSQCRVDSEIADLFTDSHIYIVSGNWVQYISKEWMKLSQDPFAVQCSERCRSSSTGSLCFHIGRVWFECPMIFLTGGTKTWGGGGGSILHWQASNLVKCVVSTAAPVRAIANLKREGETKKDCAFKWSFNAWHNSGSLMPPIYSIMYIYIQGRGGGSRFWNFRIHTYLHNHGKDNKEKN